MGDGKYERRSSTQLLDIVPHIVRLDIALQKYREPFPSPGKRETGAEKRVEDHMLRSRRPHHPNHNNLSQAFDASSKLESSSASQAHVTARQ